MLFDLANIIYLTKYINLMVDTYVQSYSKPTPLVMLYV